VCHSPYNNTYAHEFSHILGLSDQTTDPNDITYGTAASRSANSAPSGNDIANIIQNNPSWGTVE